MSPELVRFLNIQFNEIMKMPDIQAKMEMLTIAPVGGDPDKLSKLIASDYARYGRVVKEFGIQAD